MTNSANRRLRGAAAALLVFVPRSAAAEEFQLLHFDGFEDCALAFRDADADGFGAAGGVMHACDPLPAGRIRLGGDCDDSDVIVNPAAEEPFPDAAYADENCDGVDGDASLALFVSPTGAGIACTRDAPCSLAAVPSVSISTGRTQWFLATGTYPAAIVLSGAGIERNVFGGYSSRYSLRAAPSSGNASIVAGALDTLAGTFAARVEFGARLLLSDLRLAPPTATMRSANGEGLSSFGAIARNGAQLALHRVQLVPGNGMSGAAGTNGSPSLAAAATEAMAGIAGGGGDEFPTACDSSSRGAAGIAGTHSCSTGARATAGGAGGRGGAMDTNCTPFSLNFDARPGEPGSDATYAVPGFGKGGLRGEASTSSCPDTATDGLPGAVTDGSAGSAAQGFALNGSQVAPRTGNAGTLGDNSGGGGGGGGASGCDDGTDAYGAGGGGGGAGGCAASQPGSGGRGGGSSIGVLALDSNVSFVAVTVQVGSGGKGGAGGDGGFGQTGGPGGPSAPIHPGTFDPGAGGNGGRGGHAGAGAGGNGGNAIGVLVSGSVLTGIPTVSAGTPGAGGEGGSGATPALDGEDGAAGLSLAQRTCATPSNC